MMMTVRVGVPSVLPAMGKGKGGHYRQTGSISSNGAGFVKSRTGSGDAMQSGQRSNIYSKACGLSLKRSGDGAAAHAFKLGCWEA